MSVNIREPHRTKDVGRKWLVDIGIVFEGGEVVRRKFIVGNGTIHETVKNEKQAKDWGLAEHAKPFRTTLSKRDYADVRALGDEYRSRKPRNVAV